MITDRASARYEQLIKRPEPVNGIELPTVRNLVETSIIGDLFGAVLTAGPESDEVRFGFKNHRVWTFHDSDHPYYGPQLFQVEEMVFWGAEQEDLLIHCHAGMSRSTATAWGVAIARGLDPYDALVSLREAHPQEAGENAKRWFCPNALLVEHLQDVFGNNTLMDIRYDVLQDDRRIAHWL
jgi:hypothetical protein